MRDRIALMNAIAEHLFGRSIRVTAWKKESPFHETMEAFDVGRCSAGDRAAFGSNTWTEEMAKRFEDHCLKAGIPLVVVYEGQPAEHWHVGDVATLVFERAM